MRRKNYTKEEKIAVLHEYSLGKKSFEAFLCANVELDSSNFQDEKYASKLINKWKSEVYKIVHVGEVPLVYEKLSKDKLFDCIINPAIKEEDELVEYYIERKQQEEQEENLKNKGKTNTNY